jgi:hypothetical protein
MSGGKGGKGGNLESLRNRGLSDEWREVAETGGNWRKPEILPPAAIRLAVSGRR